MIPIQRTVTEVVSEEDRTRVIGFWTEQGYEEVGTLHTEGTDSYCITFIKTDKIWRQVKFKQWEDC